MIEPVIVRPLRPGRFELERAAHHRPPAARKPAAGVHPDQAAFATQLEDGFTALLGRDTRVEPTTAGEFRLVGVS